MQLGKYEWQKKWINELTTALFSVSFVWASANSHLNFAIREGDSMTFFMWIVIFCREGQFFFFVRTNQIVVLYIDSSFLLLHIFPGTDKILSRFVTHWIVMEIFPFPQKKGIQRQCNAKILDIKFEMFLITYLLNEKDRFGSKIKVECKFCST